MLRYWVNTHTQFIRQAKSDKPGETQHNVFKTGRCTQTRRSCWEKPLFDVFYQYEIYSTEYILQLSVQCVCVQPGSSGSLSVWLLPLLVLLGQCFVGLRASHQGAWSWSCSLFPCNSQKSVCISFWLCKWDWKCVREGSPLTFAEQRVLHKVVEAQSVHVLAHFRLRL